MTLTKEMIAGLRFPGRTDIDAKLETFLLTQYGAEPYPHELTEQDLYEQVRKHISRYYQDKGADGSKT